MCVCVCVQVCVWLEGSEKDHRYLISPTYQLIIDKLVESITGTSDDPAS